MSDTTSQDPLLPWVDALRGDPPPIPQDYVEAAEALAERAEAHPESPTYICAVHELLNARQRRDGAGYGAWIVDAAERLLDPAVREASNSCISCVRSTQATALFDLGRYHEADAAIHAAFEALERRGTLFVVADVNATRLRKRAQCHILMGDEDAARAFLKRHIEARAYICDCAVRHLERNPHLKDNPDNYFVKFAPRKARALARNRTLVALLDADMERFDAEFEPYLEGCLDPGVSAFESRDRVDFVFAVQTMLAQREAWRALVRHAGDMDRVYAKHHRVRRQVVLGLEVARAQCALGDLHEARYALHKAIGQRSRLIEDEALDAEFEAVREAIQG